MDGETVTYDRRQGCCMHCGSLSFSQEWLNAFQVGCVSLKHDSSCNDASKVEANLLRTYGDSQVTICNSCKSQEELITKVIDMLGALSTVESRRHQLHLETSACIAQGNAKSLYMLSDGDLKKLGSLAKANPQKPCASLQP